ncbi:MAG: hypothetical protein QF921_10505 [Pseudomonadales bacterium]|jgi:hypothetical protein|nr:hypothetical protein [Pseudomonadales bacterium]MDP6469762.1 hypothetical protein [Pseudomonadales bacterium]MDP6827636.1 hypothetical protein [Pseudomonadales bacterium]MDP6971923.1 hypothetical protein [Pseudomonadales bacterium]|tara:strand:+ start:98 stop:304 length:207 start_codon:yes stop_codon:yes gene_type:complete
MWSIEDLGSANSTFIEGHGIATQALGSATRVRLAESGLEAFTEIAAQDTPTTMILQPGAVVSQPGDRT